MATILSIEPAGPVVGKFDGVTQFFVMVTIAVSLFVPLADEAEPVFVRLLLPQAILASLTVALNLTYAFEPGV